MTKYWPLEREQNFYVGLQGDVLKRMAYTLLSFPAGWNVNVMARIITVILNHEVFLGIKSLTAGQQIDGI